MQSIAQTFTHALEIAELLARQHLRVEMHERISCGVALVRAGAVHETDDAHLWRVDSRSTPGKQYTVNGTCGCDDAHYRAPQGRCAHVLAVLLVRKALELLAPPVPALPPPAPAPEEDPLPAPLRTPAAPLAEAECSVSVQFIAGGRDYRMTFRGQEDAAVLARMDAALARYPVAPPAATAHGPQGEGWCATHALQMRWNEGKHGKKGWFSHKTPEGWCRGR